MWDIHRAAVDARGLAGSPGTVGWNSQSQSLAFWRLDDAEFTRRLRRTQALEDFADSLVARNVNGLPLFDDFGQGADSLVWLEPIQLAHDQGTAISLARSGRCSDPEAVINAVLGNIEE